ncbi:transglutaminase family protein [Sphingomonas sp.]|uniref:transglutaminase family protein n=1 Tax=Sphingomonas sp. TaxID=28214 RepID=UPI001EC0A9B9|nr:transglutaminase family protein [Sphingomonas sp.]MBX3594421.1 transglutaminase family protein [Sphingomonas sp.]
MRLAVEHRTVYRFSQPQTRLVQMLRLTPGDTFDQTVLSWRIDVDCDVRLRDMIDGFGNKVTMLYAEGPIDAIEITVEGQVLTTESNGVVRGSSEPLPEGLFLRTTPRTLAGPALKAFAADAAVGHGLEALHRWNLAIAGRFPLAGDRPDGGQTAGEAFDAANPTSRDLAHIFIAGARGAGVPARYVSGYRQGVDEACAPHGWAEAWVDDLGWVGFDPSAGVSPDEAYVRAAVGLDAVGAAPIAGSRLGEGGEEMSVDLHVDRLGSDA